MNVTLYLFYRDHRHIDSMPGLWLPGLAASQITTEPLFTPVFGLRGSALIACQKPRDHGVFDTQ
jgi:hypothetical protein